MYVYVYTYMCIYTYIKYIYIYIYIHTYTHIHAPCEAAGGSAGCGAPWRPSPSPRASAWVPLRDIPDKKFDFQKTNPSQSTNHGFCFLKIKLIIWYIARPPPVITVVGLLFPAPPLLHDPIYYRISYTLLYHDIR